MVDLNDNLGWVPATRIEVSDLALGGTEASQPNKTMRELASRDAYLFGLVAPDALAAASFEKFKQLGIAGVANGRLGLESGVPVSSSDRLAQTTLYYTPYNGDAIALWNSAESRWDLYTFTERSLSLSGLSANTNYDVFAFVSGGTVTLQAVAWTSSGAGSSSRASVISLKDGVWVKSSDDRRFLGSIRITGTIGQCEDSQQSRLVWNVQNREPRVIRHFHSGSSYTYLTATWRAAANAATNRINVVTGLAQSVQVLGGLITTGGGANEPGGGTGVGLNSTSVNSAQLNTDRAFTPDQFVLFCFATVNTVAGYNQLVHLELGSASGGSFTVVPSGGSGLYGDGLIALWNC